MLEVVAGLAGGSLVAGAGYQSMAPTGQWFGSTFVGLRRGTAKLALTYDDGPNDPHTLRLLETLAKHGVRATFFLIGGYVRRRPDIVREIAKAGHAIGNHTFSHPNLIFASTAETGNEIQQCQQALEDAAGEHSRLFRPPFGGRRPGTLAIARQLGLIPIMWNVTGWDWRGKPAEYVEGKVWKQIGGGDVVLLHDGSHAGFGADRSATVTATDGLIPRCKTKGYEFTTIPDMMAAPAMDAEPVERGA